MKSTSNCLTVLHLANPEQHPPFARKFWHQIFRPVKSATSLLVTVVFNFIPVLGSISTGNSDSLMMVIATCLNSYRSQDTWALSASLSFCFIPEAINISKSFPITPGNHKFFLTLVRKISLELKVMLSRLAFVYKETASPWHFLKSIYCIPVTAAPQLPLRSLL